MPLSDTVLTCNSSSCSPRLHRALSIVMVIVGIVIPFIIIRYRVPGHDECFQALNVRDYSHSPMAMLTFYLGNVWCRLFGDTLLALRSLMVVELQLSIALGCGWFYRKTSDGFVASFLFLFMSLLSTHCTLFIYGWDLGAYLFITLTLLATLYYMERGSRLSVILVGASTAFMALARIPTLAILPVLLGIIIWRTKKRLDASTCLSVPVVARTSPLGAVVSDSLIGLIAFSVTAVAIIGLMCGIGGYVSAFDSENIVSEHTMLQGYIDRLYMLTPAAFKLWLLVGVLAVTSLVLKRKVENRWVLLLKAVIFSVIGFVAYFAIRLIASQSADFGFAQGVLAVTGMYIPVYNALRREKLPCPVAFLVTMAMFSLLAVVGSDSIIERPLTFAVIPFAAVVLYPYRKGMLGWFYGIAFWTSLLVIASSIVSQFRNNTYHVDVSRVASLHLNDEREWLFSTMKKLTDSFKAEGKTVAYWGKSRYFLDYVISDDVPPLLQLYHYYEVDDRMIEQAAEALKPFDVIIIQWNPLYDGNTYEPLADKLSKRGFRREIISDNFWVLKKSPE